MFRLNQIFCSESGKYGVLQYKIFQNRSTNRAAFCAYSEFLYNPLPFNTTQIINPLLTSRLSVDPDKGLGFQPIGESLYSLMFLQCIIAFVVVDFSIHVLDKTIIFKRLSSYIRFKNLNKIVEYVKKRLKGINC